jgi:hypothetical protein
MASIQTFLERIANNYSPEKSTFSECGWKYFFVVPIPASLPSALSSWRGLLESRKQRANRDRTRRRIGTGRFFVNAT